MVTTNDAGIVRPLFLKDVSDENGRVIPRLVDMESGKIKLICRHGIQYIEPSDYDAAKKYVDHPEVYNMMNILNW